MPIYEGYAPTNRPLEVKIETLMSRATRDSPNDEWLVRLLDDPRGVETPYAIAKLDRRLRFAYEGSQSVGAPIELPHGTMVHWLDGCDGIVRAIVVDKLTYWHREPEEDAYTIEATTAAGRAIEFACLVSETAFLARCRVSRDTREPMTIRESLGVPVETIYGKPD